MTSTLTPPPAPQARRTRTTPGRPSKLSPAVRDRLLNLLRAGADRRQAVRHAGVGKTAFYRWMARGREQQTGEFRDFRDAVRQAEAQAELRDVLALDQMAREAAKHPKTFAVAARILMWRLERRNPKRWGQRTHTTVAGDKSTPIFGNVVFELEIDSPLTRRRRAALAAPLAPDAAAPLPVDAGLVEIPA